MSVGTWLLTIFLLLAFVNLFLWMPDRYREQGAAAAARALARSRASGGAWRPPPPTGGAAGWRPC